MKLHYAGKFNNDENSLPKREHPKNYVAFKEPDAKTFSIIANVGSFLLMFLLMIPFFLIGKTYLSESKSAIFIGCLCSCLSLLPHECLHALCFKEDVYLYTNLSRGMLFVVGVEDMTRSRFIFMSLLPNLVFGFIPYLLFFIHPQWIALGFFGLMCISMGFGDYINIYNCLTQVPKDGLVYLNGFHSYWYKK